MRQVDSVEQLFNNSNNAFLDYHFKNYPLGTIKCFSEQNSLIIYITKQIFFTFKKEVIFWWILEARCYTAAASEKDIDRCRRDS